VTIPEKVERVSNRLAVGGLSSSPALPAGTTPFTQHRRRDGEGVGERCRYRRRCTAFATDIGALLAIEARKADRSVNFEAGKTV
jgi:hypothetical protein